MLRWIVGSSLRFRFIVVAVSGTMIFVGAVQLRHTSVDVFPEFAPPRVEIQTPSLGLSSSEVESLITIPLEQTLNGVPGLDVIRSRSVEQLSSIELIFEPGTDLLSARHLVAERLAAITPTLPRWSMPPFMIQPLSATSRVLKIGLSSTDPDVDLMDMSLAAYYKIRTRLLRVPGVANVPIWGQRKDNLNVMVDPERLREHDVPLEQVMTATSDSLDTGLISYSAGDHLTGGCLLDTPTKRLRIAPITPIVSVGELADVPVEVSNGDVLRLGDVAELVRDHQPLIGDAVINDGAGLMLIVEKLPWGNTLDVTRGVEAALEELAPGLPGIAVDHTIFRPATFIEQAINNLGSAMLIGALLMILMLGAFLYATLIEVVAVAPIFMLEGLSGSFFQPLVTSYALALLASMVVALTVTPALSLIFFRSEASLRSREAPLVPPLKRAYEAILRRVVFRPRRAYAAVGATALLGVAVFPFLGQNLLPDFKERDFLMHWLGTPSTSHPEMVRTTKRVNRELLTIPGVRNAGSHIGQALHMDEVVGMYFGENWVSVDPSVDYDQTLDAIQDTVDGYPGIFRDVQTYLKERIREVLTGSSEAITMRIYGQDVDLLREKAEEVNEILADIPGVVENHVDFQEKIPQIKVEVDLEAAKRHGIKPGDVRRAASWLMAGEEAGDIFRGGRAYDVQLWSPPEDRRNLTQLKNLLLDTPSGEQVR